MANNIEIEAKVLIDEQSYKVVKNHCKDHISDFYTQTNYYIDTPKFDLRNNGIGLRVREKQNKYEITLKTPMSEGLLEKTEPISKEQFKELRDKGIFPETKIKSFIMMLGFDFKISDLKILAHLTTERIDISTPTGTFSIDKNTYFDKTDYELEKEGNNLKEAENFLEDLCITCKIPYSINKVSKMARALNELKQ